VLPRISKRLAVVLTSMALGVGVLFAMAAPASATYGPTAQYQVELSANLGGPGAAVSGSGSR
jgi:hypothetical protein